MCVYNGKIKMYPRNSAKASKFLSYILRHHPEKIGINLDKNGYVDICLLINALQSNGWENFTKADLDQIILTNNKKRFAYNDEKTKIRASQGHSIKVDLNLKAQAPPHFLYHGTIKKFLLDIKKEGLKKRARHHVHLSVDVETAKDVGSRRGKPIILKISSKLMCFEGHLFYKSANGVWLTECVPFKYIILIE